MMTSRSTFGSFGHAIDKYWKMFISTDGAYRDYKSWKETPTQGRCCVSSILSYVPEKKVRQAINAVAKTW